MKKKQKQRLIDRYNAWLKKPRTWHEYVEDVKDWSEVFKSGYDKVGSNYIGLDQA